MQRKNTIKKSSVSIYECFTYDVFINECFRSLKLNCNKMIL